MQNKVKIQKFIEASNANDLRNKMTLMSQKYGEVFTFHSIQFAQGKWYAWYEDYEPVMQRAMRNNAAK